MKKVIMKVELENGIRVIITDKADKSLVKMFNDVFYALNKESERRQQYQLNKKGVII